MKRTAGILIFVAIAILAYTGAADTNLVRGEDRIDVPSIGEGLCVHNIFQSNMVIQRDKPIRIWGWAEPDMEVTVAFDDHVQSVKTLADRLWKVEFPAMPASAQPRKIVIKGKDKVIELDNILIGDIWVLGGQSNMEFEIAKVEDGELEVISSNFPNIRLFTVPHQNGPDLKKSFPSMYQWSDWSSRHFRQGFWDVCSPETVRDMSAIGYVFARRIHMAAQVPIGVVDTSIGGTTLETWTPDEVLRTIDTPEVKAMLEDWDKKIAEFDPQLDLEDQVKKYNEQTKRMEKEGKDVSGRKAPTDPRPGPAMDRNRPGNCYASMLAPIAGFQVKGAIWHQGYNNCFDGSRGADMYYQVFPKMISAWRAAFNNSEMPFGIITLCTQGDKQTLDNFCSQMLDAGPYIREAQYKTFLDLYNAGDTNIGFSVTYDLRRRWYHPQLKIPAGERIARWALATQYGFGRDLRWKPPMVGKVEAGEGSVRIYFNEKVANVDDGGGIEGFAVAGADGRFHPATASHLVKGKDDRGREQKDMNVIVLTSHMVPEPIHYRYAWARNPMGNVQAQNIPMATQRSDNWTMGDTFEVLTGKKTAEPGVLSRGENGELGKALREEDIRRRMSEAKALLAEGAGR